jgi:DnaK suppressor protein
MKSIQKEEGDEYNVAFEEMDSTEIEEKLKTERRQIAEALNEKMHPGNELVEGWQELDDPSEREIREVEFSQREALCDRLRKIDGAIERLRDKTYGNCTECKRPIFTKRLMADPAIALCIDCQAATEGEVVAHSL